MNYLIILNITKSFNFKKNILKKKCSAKFNILIKLYSLGQKLENLKQDFM